MQLSTTIDTLICLILILLLLSLMVQSIQELLKRLFQVKARLLQRVIRAYLPKVAADDFLGFAVATNGFSSSPPEAASAEDLRHWLDQLSVGILCPGADRLVQRQVAAIGAVDRKILELERALVAGAVQVELVQLRAALEDVSRITSSNSALLASSVLNAQFLLSEAINQTKAIEQIQPSAAKQCHQLMADLVELNKAFHALNSSVQASRSLIEGRFAIAMAAFDRRYQDVMRRWTLFIGFSLVLLFNASFFRLARHFQTSEFARRAIIENPVLIENLTGQCPKADGEELTACLQRTLTAAGASSLSTVLMPVTRSEASRYLWGLPSSGGLLRLSADLLGWIVTTVLLSAGAPFWQDVLQALFGLKNLIRGTGAKSEADFVAQ